MNWLENLPIDPLPALRASGDEELVFSVEYDLEDKKGHPLDMLWGCTAVKELLAKQREDGSWKYPGVRKHGREGENYDLLQTYRFLRILIEQYRLNLHHPAIGKAAGYVFAHQTDEGDVRGIFGNQYVTHYCSGLMELLIKAGFGDYRRIHKGFKWLLEVRQDDGGWAFPLRTARVDYYKAIDRPKPVKTDKSKPFSHMLTGFVLRAFSAHPEYRKLPEARKAGELLKSRFFKADKYSDRRAPHYWIKFQFPYWWPNILTDLDTLSGMGFLLNDPDINRGVDWFIKNQEEDGLWATSYGKGRKADPMRLWVGLAVCRVLKRLYEE